MSIDTADDYEASVTATCEQVLVTLLGDIGPWSERVYLVGGLAPRYLVGQLVPGALEHVGTTDVDLVIGLTVDDAPPETYRTLEKNLRDSGFTSGESSFQWTRRIGDVVVQVEFLCDTDAVDRGRIFRPKGEHVGSSLGAFNVRGAQLVADDFSVVQIEAERLDNGGRSRVEVRLAGLLPYVVLKTFAFQDRHKNKDAYDLIYVLLNFGDSPRAAGAFAVTSSVANDPIVSEALALLAVRFADTDQDGPTSYAAFLARQSDPAQLRQQAVATVRDFLAGYSSRANDEIEP